MPKFEIISNSSFRFTPFDYLNVVYTSLVYMKSINVLSES